MVLQKLEPGTLIADQVFNAIHEAIMSGALQAGEHLRIRNLAEELGTSVMPVREAIRRLEESGLAEKVPYKGSVVKEFLQEELLHVYAVRRLLEVEAARLGAAVISTDDVERMRKEFGAMRESLEEDRVTDYLDHDEQLLSILYSAAGNPVLTETIRTLWNRCRSYKIVGVQQALASGDHSPLLTFQAQLVDAAASNDPDGASGVNDQSVRRATERVQEGLPSRTAFEE
ncbi:GntR family transcriptional regulator [Arthrobacter pigmenti]